MSNPNSSRVFRSSGYGLVYAKEIRLNDADRKPGTLGWLTRFSLVTTGETAENWPTINAHHVDGILSPDGDWQADFPEPSIDQPTKF